MISLLTGLLVAVTASMAGCPPCSITLEHVLTIGSDDDVGWVGYPTQVLQDGADYLVFLEDEPFRGRLFRRDGSLGRLFGRKGDGPGEFKRVVGAVVVGGVLTIVDGAKQEAVTIGPSDSITTFRVPLRFMGPQAVTAMRDGSLLLNAISPHDLTRPMHVVDRMGRRVLSFGRGHPVDYLQSIYAADIGPEGEIWIAPYARQGLEAWNPDGTLGRRIELEDVWFRDENRGPRAAQMDVRVDNDVIWVLSRIGADDWRSAVLEGSSIGIPETQLTIDYTRYYSGVLQAFDRASGRVVAERIFQPPELLRQSSWLVRFVDGIEPLVIALRSNEDDQPRLDLWRMSLSRPDVSTPH